jgi:Spy/CpxP family protein refolding chaperone
MKSKIIALSVVLGVVASGALFLGCRHKYKSPEKRAEWIVGKIASELDLDDDQKLELDRIKDEALEKYREHREKRKAIHGRVIELVKSDTLDVDEVNRIFDEREKKMKKMRPFIIEKITEFHRILKPEQKEKLAEKLQEFKKRHEAY